MRSIVAITLIVTCFKRFVRKDAYLSRGLLLPGTHVFKT